MTIAVSPSVANELPVLNTIYQEAQPYFQQIEGRDPLAPLGDIHAVIPEIPVDRTHCLTLYHDEQIIGYAWTFAETSTNIYLLHFYISQANRRRGLGRACMQALGRQYRQQGYQTIRLMVSAANYLGLKFWVAVGFTHLCYVEAPPENTPTKAIELELQLDLANEEK